MAGKTARLFANGGSQAVRLPADFRFPGDRVFIRRDERTGEVILSPKEEPASLAEYLKQRDAVAVPAKDLDAFMQNRPLNEPLPPSPLARRRR
jgi:antitoxin VapB